MVTITGKPSAWHPSSTRQPGYVTNAIPLTIRCMDLLTTFACVDLRRYRFVFGGRLGMSHHAYG